MIRVFSIGGVIYSMHVQLLHFFSLEFYTVLKLKSGEKVHRTPDEGDSDCVFECCRVC